MWSLAFRYRTSTVLCEPRHDKTEYIFVNAKTKMQISCAVTAQLLCFCYPDSTISLLLQSEISSFYPFSVTVQARLCQTWSETPKTVFSHGVACMLDSWTLPTEAGILTHYISLGVLVCFMLRDKATASWVSAVLLEPQHQKINNLHMLKQRRRPAVQ